MKKKPSKKSKQIAKKPTVRRQSAKAVITKNTGDIQVGYSILKSSRLPTRAMAYNKKNGLQVLLHDKKYIPKWVLEELTDEEVSKMLLKDGAEK